VLARVRSQLLARIASNWLRDQNAVLEAEVARRMEENELIQAASIRALAHLAETRDPETGNHILRTQGYVRLLATRLQHHGRFAETLTDGYIKMLADSAPLHDIGKVGIPDSILQKPGKLTPDEWEIMKTHSKLGSDAIEQAERDIAHPVEFLSLAKEVAHWHHERWDGRGYPDGLIAESIPISARLMTIADVFDALISKRVYKDAMPIDKVREIIVGERGKQFDPDVTDIFLASFTEFAAIAEQHSDG
jgi:putative two-component system response regulator